MAIGENMEHAGLDRGFWKGKRVLVTGHTGFKGGWLSVWLLDMGAIVTGFALEPYTPPTFFKLCGLERRMQSTIGDVRNRDAIAAKIVAFRPEIVFHLAAQPIVRRSYREPLYTFETNAIGTAHVLEAVRAAGSVKSVVIVTSDKCYENSGTSVPLRETDALGGHDPYSASKGCAEIVAACYRKSFLEDQGVALATARAGNVIGGGDWAQDRLIPDAIRALSGGESLIIRNPDSVRPWQHVLEPLYGYLLLGQRLCVDGSKLAGSWNFGPHVPRNARVREVVEALFRLWGAGRWIDDSSSVRAFEDPTLALDAGKAWKLLGWKTLLPLEDALAMTIEWYRSALAHPENHELNLKTSIVQLRNYEDCVANAHQALRSTPL